MFAFGPNLAASGDFNFLFSHGKKRADRPMNQIDLVGTTSRFRFDPV
jgi:hypothetical protein